MSCCGRKGSNFYTRTNVGKTCCNNKCGNNNYGHHSNNSCCGQSNNNTSCCSQQNSCCSQQNNCYSQQNNCCSQQNNCCSQTYDNTCYESNCCNNNNGLDGISCPFHNNNDCECESSLKDALCNLTNQRVIIHTDGCKMCVVIVSVGSCFVKTINPCTQKIVYFNINRIDNVEDVLPRCY